MIRPHKKNLPIGLLLGLCVLGFLFKTLGYLDTWRLWNIPAAWPPFMDVRVITDGAEAYKRGLDPMKGNPYDSSGRPLNYPRIWQSLYRLGFDKTDTVWFGTMSALLFVAAVIIATPPLGVSGAGGMLAAFFSPAVMFCVERGNTDLLMFFLLALALAAPARRRWWPVLLVVAAFVLKLYPLLGLAVLLGRGRRGLVRGLVGALGFALLYLLYNLDDITTILSLTLGKTWISYGWSVLGMKVGEGDPALGNILRTLSGVCVLGTLALGGLAWFRRRAGSAGEEGASLDGFRMGAACYAGTFLMGNNFDYRLVFLLFALPQLWTWSRDRNSGLTGLARVALGGIYVSLWSLLIDRLMLAWPAGPWISFLLGEAAHWVVFFTMVQLFFLNLPGWLGVTAKSDVRGQTRVVRAGEMSGAAGVAGD